MVSSAKLISAHAAKPTVGHSLVIPWLCFSRTAKPVSNSPATTIQLPVSALHRSVTVPVPAACAVQIPAVRGGAGITAPG